MTSGHQSVLLSEAIEYLQIQPDDTVIDATIGGAGHFSALLSALGAKGTLIGIDADSEAITRGEKVIESFAGEGKKLPHTVVKETNFRNLAHVLDELSIESVDKVLFDLGWSGYQLSAGRGFSFQNDEPLLMTYGAEANTTSADAINSLPEEELADILYQFGEEQFSRKIAKAIIEERKHSKIFTTKHLVEVVEKGTPSWYHHRRIHPATKTFQALRIYVNDELGALEEGLSSAIERTHVKGRIAVITFHSLEDRVVKNIFRDSAKEGRGHVVNKKPLGPSDAEVEENPRARSAKLRVFERD